MKSTILTNIDQTMHKQVGHYMVINSQVNYSRTLVKDHLDIETTLL